MAETCRNEILAYVHSIANDGSSFTIEDIMQCMKERGTTYSDNTIKTHIASRMCRNAPEHHATTYPDFERVGRGVYRLLNEVGTDVKITPKDDSTSDI